jgi:hypothetical protein
MGTDNDCDNDCDKDGDYIPIASRGITRYDVCHSDTVKGV